MPNTNSRNARRPASSGRSSTRGPTARGASDIVTVHRSEYIGAFPSSNGLFSSATISAYPASAAIAGVTSLYTEYRYTRFHLRIVPRASTSTVGSIWCAVLGAPPRGAPTSLQSAAMLSRFQTRSAGHGPAFGVNVDTRVALRPWFLTTVRPTADQLTNPDYVQFWFVVGSANVQSGVVPADLFVTYTIKFRSTAPLPGTTTTTYIPRFSLLEEDRKSVV